MSNGEVCCILRVCCDRAQRKTRAVTVIAAETGLTPEQADSVFEWFDSRFDFAPKDTLQPLIDAIAEHARAHKKP